MALGPLVGGALTQAIGWQSIFFLNIPVGIAAIAVTVLKVAESRDETARGVDWGGTVTFSAANALLVLALLRGNDDGWTSGVILGLLAAAIVLFAAFVAIELRVAQPMLPLEPLPQPRLHRRADHRVRAQRLDVRAVPLHHALHAGDRAPLAPAGRSALPAVHRRLVLRRRRDRVAGGEGPCRACCSRPGSRSPGSASLLMSGAKPNDSWTVLLPGFIVGGLGVGLVNPVLANVALSTVPERMSGVASGINDTFRQVAIASGTAGLGALFLALSQAADPGSPAERERPARARPGGSGLLRHASRPVRPRRSSTPRARASPTASPASCSSAARMALVGAVLALLLVRDSDLRHDDAPELAAEPAAA